MMRSAAERLLGGYATGTLTADERRALFTAALGHQAIFDALMDEEILRELLADPEAKARLLAALATAPKVVPFWRRTGVLGAAASLIVAATAGLAYLRSPNAMRSVVRPEARQEAKSEPAAKAAEAPATLATAAPAAKATTASTAKATVASAAGQASPELQRQAAPAGRTGDADQPRQKAVAPLAPAPPAPATAPAPQSMTASAAGAPIAEDSARLQEKADYRRAVARDQLAKKTEARPTAAAVAEVAAEVVAPATEPAPTAAKAKALGGLAMNAAAFSSAPTWALEAQPDGSTRVTVSVPRGRSVVLLRRGLAGVEVLPLQASDDRGKALVLWRVELRLAAGDVLDLYLLNAPVVEPAKLPETGPVDGFRARIHPAAK
jgi:hypothetical protein